MPVRASRLSVSDHEQTFHCRQLRWSDEETSMPTQKQRRAARKNIKKAAKAAKKKQTLKRLPKKTRRALGKQAAKVRQSRA
jgi:hypothetical protein